VCCPGYCSCGVMESSAVSFRLRVIIVIRDIIYIIIILYSWHLVICEHFWFICVEQLILGHAYDEYSVWVLKPGMTLHALGAQSWPVTRQTRSPYRSPQENLILRGRVQDSHHPVGGYLPSYLVVGASLQESKLQKVNLC
jgi:hypothetical protein